MQTPAERRAWLILQSEDRSGRDHVASNPLNLDSGDPQVVELTIRKLRKLADGFAVAHVRADSRDNIRQKHGVPPEPLSGPKTKVFRRW